MLLMSHSCRNSASAYKSNRIQMNPQEQKTLEVINAHRQRVFNLMSHLSQEVMRRGNEHDETKLGPEELPHYVATIDEFEKHPFGSDGYFKAKESLGPSVVHHYKHNRHHPENPGNTAKSLVLAIGKYKISPQLTQILLNTMTDFEM